MEGEYRPSKTSNKITRPKSGAQLAKLLSNLQFSACKHEKENDHTMWFFYWGNHASKLCCNKNMTINGGSKQTNMQVGLAKSHGYGQNRDSDVEKSHCRTCDRKRRGFPLLNQNKSHHQTTYHRMLKKNKGAKSLENYKF